MLQSLQLNSCLALNKVPLINGILIYLVMVIIIIHSSTLYDLRTHDVMKMRNKFLKEDIRDFHC